MEEIRTRKRKSLPLSLFLVSPRLVSTRLIASGICANFTKNLLRSLPFSQEEFKKRLNRFDDGAPFEWTTSCPDRRGVSQRKHVPGITRFRRALHRRNRKLEGCTFSLRSKRNYRLGFSARRIFESYRARADGDRFS